MGGFCSRLCSTPEDPGDKAFDAGIEAYGEFQGIEASQRDSAEAQALLSKAVKSYNLAADHYRRARNPNLGAVLVNLATMKWDMYRSGGSATETDEKNSTRAADLLEEVIKLDGEALTLWQAREPKPEQYPTLLINLAEAYRERFVKNKQSTDVQQAIRLYKDARDHTEATTKPHAEAVKELGIAHWMSYNAVSKDDQLESAIQCLMDANSLAQHKYPDIQYSCLYTLAWINHYRFDRQEEQSPANPTTPQYLDDAIHFYRSTLQSAMPQNDPRYAKALWFVPMLLFHRYERDNSANDLQEARTRAQEALSFPSITDEEQRKQLTAVLIFDSAASPETTREARRAMRRTTMNSFRTSSDGYSIMPSATMQTVFEADAAGSHSPGADGREKTGSQFGFSGAGMITEEPSGM
jgi:tetratricopeptide (TPR) repeat protein